MSAERFRGIRIFDITDLKKAEAGRGGADLPRIAHAHAGHRSEGQGEPSTSTVRARARSDRAKSWPAAPGSIPKEDPNTALFSIDVIKVPLASAGEGGDRQSPAHLRGPEDRRHRGPVAGRRSRAGHAELADDQSVSRHHGLPGDRPGRRRLLGQRHPDGHLRSREPGAPRSRRSTRTSPTGTRRRSTTTAPRSCSPTSGAAVGRPRCRATDLPTWGADAIFDIVDKKLRFGGYYKMPAAQTEQENCVAHNGSLIPVPGRDIMVQAWYQGGVSVFDFTDSANAVRDCVLRPRPDRRDKQLVSGGYWSTYWYNGNIYGAEIARGLDVFRLTAERAPDAERDRRRHAGPLRASSTRSSSRASPGRRRSSSRARISISSRGARRCRRIA